MHKHIHKIDNKNEKKVFLVIILTVITMIAEIMFGYLSSSMALLADGYHMGTHALALGFTYIAYILVRKFKNSEYFPNGTDKISVLAAYTSSLLLGITGIWIIVEAVHRFFNPLQIQFNEAIIVAVIGFIVNAACIFIMGINPEHKHSDSENINHNDTEKKDYNFLAAYYHILADLLTSILAIAALFLGKYFNLLFLDSIIGFLGGFLILRWAAGLIKSTVKILIDMRK